MKRIFKPIITTCIILMCACISSCTDETLQEMGNSNTLPPFKLHVNQNTSSRLALGEDGLSVVWEPGDQLVMVKKDKSGEPIYLDCDLEEVAYSATFTAGEGVPVGDYYVFYNYDRYIGFNYDNQGNPVYTCTHQELVPTERINDEDKLALWGEVSVKDGDSSASIVLQHIYAKVRISIKSFYSANRYKSFKIGMYASKGGFPSHLMFTENGVTNAIKNGNTCYPSETEKVHNVRLSDSFYPISDIGTFDNDENYTALILPADLSEGSLFVYGICDDDSYGNQLVCFETEKKNVKFEAGKSYKISLYLGYPNDENPDHKAINMYAIEDEENRGTYLKLSTPEECRVAAYLSSDEWYYYQVTNDIDFQGQTFLPISTEKIVGNGHTIKNISLDWPDSDNVGLVRNNYPNVGLLDMRIPTCTISDLTLENVSFNGHSFVGAFGGVGISTNNCKVTGNSSITGSGDFVGGIVGYTIGTSLINTSIDASCTIKGINCVGGISGGFCGNYSTMKSLTSSATVTATGDYIGGITGFIGSCFSDSGFDRTNYYINGELNITHDGWENAYSKCSNYGNVTGGMYVGGIAGKCAINSSIKQLINEGNIKGESYVGGIAGNLDGAGLRIAYSIGEISASNTTVGGIVGILTKKEVSGRNENHESKVSDCYSLATISVGKGGYAGGIAGISGIEEDPSYVSTSIINCYFAGLNSTGKGIVGYDLGNTYVKNCLTTLPSLGIETNVTNSLYGVTSILENKSIINGNNAFSSEIWPLSNYPAYCPRFIDFSGDIDIPGFGDSDIEI